MDSGSFKAGISGSTLKIIAIVTMLIDHTGATVIRAIIRGLSDDQSSSVYLFWKQMYYASRSIGRLAFPIFCFFIVEGFLHTRNVKKYALRLFLFAWISEIPFDLALKGNWYHPQKQNVYFTLLIGLLVVIAMHWILSHGRGFVPLCILPLLLGMYLALRIDTDYNYKGVLLIALLYLLHENKLFQCIGGAAAVAWELPASAAFLPVYLYNGTRGRQMKYFFYWFYPVHLLLLHAAAVYAVPVYLNLICP